MSETDKALFPSILTTRLVLRPLQAADAGVLHRIYQSNGVLRYFPIPSPPSLEQLQRFVVGQQAHWEKHGYGNWGILREGEGEIIGWAGLQYLPELDETEVGFLLDRPFWGKGYATEAALASLRFGFKELALDHIIALVHPDNLASRRVIAKCGLTYVDTLSLWGMELLRYLSHSSFHHSAISKGGHGARRSAADPAPGETGGQLGTADEATAGQAHRSGFDRSASLMTGRGAPVHAAKDNENEEEKRDE